MEGDRQGFRAVMGHFATGVTVVTALDRGRAVGMTTNAVCSLSLDPLLVLVCFDNTARTLSVVRHTERFAVNVLGAGEEDLSGQFASKLPVEEKFELVEHSTRHDVPILDSALAWVACELRQLVEGGDHTIGIGAVVGMDHGEGQPLVWFRGAYTTVAPPS